MSHVTYVLPVSYVTYERVSVLKEPYLSRHGTHVHESWHTCPGVMAHISMSHVTIKKQSRESCVTYE